MTDTTRMKAHLLYRSTRILLKNDATDGGGGKGKDDKKDEKKVDEKKDEKADDKKDEKIEEPTAEELKKQQRDLKEMTRGAGRHKKKGEDKKEEKKDEKAAEKTDDKKDEKKSEEKTDEKKDEKKDDKKAAPPKQPAAKREPVDVPPPIGQVDEPAAKKDQPEFETALELRGADKRKLQVLRQMEEDGTAAKGTADRTLRFWEKEAKYKEQWEAAHAGQEFDEDADEHKNFYERNEVVYDLEEYDTSRDNLVRAEALKQSGDKQSEEKKVEKRVQEFRDAQEGIAKDSQAAVMEFIELAAAPELVALMGDGEGKALTKEVTEKMLAHDPVATEILQETAEELAVLTVELHRLTQFDDVYQASPAKPVVLKVSGRRIYPHAELLHFMQGLESEMLKMDPQATMHGKQRLVANNAFNKEYSRIAADTSLDAKAKREALEKLNANYYTLTEDDFRRGLIAQYAHNAKHELQKFAKRAGHRTPEKKDDGAKAPPADEKKDEKKDEKLEDEEISRGTRTRSPSSASASDAVDTGGKGGKEQPSDAKSAVARMRGR